MDSQCNFHVITSVNVNGKAGTQLKRNLDNENFSRGLNA